MAKYAYHATSRDAWAWTEIYLDGYGWVPIEVAPGIAQDTALNDLLDLDGTAPLPVSPGGPAADAPVGGQSSARPDTAASAGGALFGSLMSRLVNLSIPTAVYTALAVLASLLVVLITAVVLRRAVKLQRRKRALYGPDPKENLLSAYNYLEELLAFFSVLQKPGISYDNFVDRVQGCYTGVLEKGEFGDIVRPALDVGFGDKPVTHRQVQAYIRQIDHFIRKLYPRLKRRQRFALRWKRALW